MNHVQIQLGDGTIVTGSVHLDHPRPFVVVFITIHGSTFPVEFATETVRTAIRNDRPLRA